MNRPMLWNRRTFLQRLGYLSGIGFVRPPSVWSLSGTSHPLREMRATDKTAGPLFAYVGSWKHGIQVFAVERNGWRLLQTISSDRPSCLALHPCGKFLYAVNEIDRYAGLPTGTVEAYSRDGRNGRLTLLNRQALSLSAIAPRYLAVSPDGSQLIVAVHGGGSYNLLPIRADGFLERVSGILKEVGAGPDRERQNTSHPQMVIFDPVQPRFFGADLGSDRLNVLTLAEGQLNVVHRYSTEPGSGPRLLALHPSGRLLYVMNGLNASVSCFDCDAVSGQILDRLHHQPLHTKASLNNTVVTAMAMHPSGNFLYTSSSCYPAIDPAPCGIAAWHIDSATGKLDLIQEAAMRMQSSSVESLVAAHNALFALSHTEGIFRSDLDPGSGFLGHAVQVANVSAPKSMVLHYL